jgi:hypothetical protein
MTSHNHSALLGWPTVSSNFTFPTLAMTRICIQKSSDPATATDGPSEASEANLQVWCHVLFEGGVVCHTGITEIS